MSHTPLEPFVVSLYAQLQQTIQDSKSIGVEQTYAYTSKTQSGRKYWYKQITTDQSRSQEYVGPETAELLLMIQNAGLLQQQLRTNLQQRKKLVAVLIRGGVPEETGLPARILSYLATEHVFDTSVLIGSFAFSVYGPLLGVSFKPDYFKTTDMDVACRQEMEIGGRHDLTAGLLKNFPELHLPQQINKWLPPNDFCTSGNTWKIEFLTDKKTSRREPVKIEHLNVYAQPLDFLAYIMEEVTSGIILYRSGIQVTVPDPARYGLHKLAVSRLRQTANHSRVVKDLRQAESLLDVLVSERPGDLVLAWEAAGKHEFLQKLISNGLCHIDPVIAEKVRKELEIGIHTGTPGY